VETLISEEAAEIDDQITATAVEVAKNPTTDETTYSYVIDTVVGEDQSGEETVSDVDFTGMVITDGYTTASFETEYGTNDTTVSVFVNANNWHRVAEFTAASFRVRQYYEITQISNACAGDYYYGTEYTRVKKGIEVYKIPPGAENQGDEVLVASTYSTHTYSTAPTAPTIEITIDTPGEAVRIESTRYLSGVDSELCPVIPSTHPCEFTHQRHRAEAVSCTWEDYNSDWDLKLHNYFTPSGQESKAYSKYAGWEGFNGTIGRGIIREDSLGVLAQYPDTLDDTHLPADDDDAEAITDEAVNGPMDEHWYWSKWQDATWEAVESETEVTETRVNKNRIGSENTVINTITSHTRPGNPQTEGVYLFNPGYTSQWINFNEAATIVWDDPSPVLTADRIAESSAKLVVNGVTVYDVVDNWIVSGSISYEDSLFRVPLLVCKCESPLPTGYTLENHIAAVSLDESGHYLTFGAGDVRKTGLWEDFDAKGSLTPTYTQDVVPA
tara:strand:- start:8480 stop:9973 length:1494 start_codon:yes stop_codon:yes gene_type:complete